MIFLFTTINKQAELHNCIYMINSFEMGVNLLTSIVNAGDQLINVEIDDGGHKYSLPIDAFDGQSISIPVQQLEKEWQQILRKPVKQLTPTSYPWQIDLTRRRVKHQASKLNFYQQMTVELEAGIQRVKEINCSYESKLKLISRYESLLLKNQQSIIRAKSEHKLVSSKLIQLLKEYSTCE